VAIRGDAPAGDRGGAGIAARWGPALDDGEDTTLDPIAEAAHVLDTIHRRHDGVVALAARSDRWRELAALPANDLARSLAQHAGDVAVDGYVSIHGLRHPPPGWQPRRPGLRGTGAARWLTCCYADVDARGTTWGAVVGRIVDAQDSGEIPPASVIVRSGGVGGAWLLYVLRADDGPGPIPATEETLPAWMRVQARLHAAIAHAMPGWLDRGARDVSRMVRLPYSRHSETGETVRYLVLAGDDGRPITYTLGELAASLGDEPEADQQEREPARVLEWPQRAARGYVAGDRPPLRQRDTPADPARRAGGIARWAHVLADLDRLADARGGIRRGMRSRYLLARAYHLRRVGATMREVEHDLDARNRSDCRPPMTRSEVRDAVSGARGMRYAVTFATVRDWLRVTAAEADSLGLRALRPEPDASHRETRATRRARRLVALRETVATSPGLSLRGLAARLDVPVSTLRRDLRALADPSREEQEGTLSKTRMDPPPPSPPARSSPPPY
jgi:hypothetical protein